jgi:hypothetical protein
LERIWKCSWAKRGTVQAFAWEITTTTKNLSLWAVSRPIFEPSTSQIQVLRVTATPTCSVPGVYEHGNDSSGSIKDGEFLGQLSDYLLLKQD